LKTTRISEIERYIGEKKVVTLGELCEKFGISINTVRRDINELVARGSAKKVYGGVCSVSRDLVPFDERRSENADGKEAIAKLAASFVNDGDIIFIDSGTTTHLMVPHLAGKRVTVLTASLNVCIDALGLSELNVISVGGALSRKTSTFSGVKDFDFLRDVNINKAFMAATGISVTGGVTNSSVDEYQIKKNVVEKSENVFLLADSSKFGKSSMMTFCRLEDVDCLITDVRPPQEFITFFSDCGNRIITPADAE
jgi:DeoR family myo-inositol catabolism operon transcriptional repressor